MKKRKGATLRGSGKTSPPKKSIVKTVRLSDAELRKLLLLQKENETQEKFLIRTKKIADKALKKFRPRKSDRGRIVFVGVTGGRNPEQKNRKGYMVLVSKSGKKSLVENVSRKTPYSPRFFSDAKPKGNKGLAKKVKEFIRSKLVLRKGGKTIVTNRGGLAKTRKGSDFSGGTISKISATLKKVISRQGTEKPFVIQSLVLIRGYKQPIELLFNVSKADVFAIKKGGVANYVKHQFYGQMAKQLAYLGFVTRGSANHIRQSMKQKVTAQVWENYHKENNPGSAELWVNPRFEIVDIETIEWRILESQ